MNSEKLDILCFGAHPDDVELSCSGTILKHVAMGKRVGIVDLTRGELGTRGTPELREEEAAKAAEILGVEERVNLEMPDGFFDLCDDNKIKIIEVLRTYQPDVVICNAPKDRHPDHGRAGQLVAESCFLSGLRKIETIMDGEIQEAWRPKKVYHYIQDRYLEPDFVIDVTPFIEEKMDAIFAYASQFYNPESDEPETPISSQNFIDHVKGRMSSMGRLIGAAYGEGYIAEFPLGIKDITELN